MHQLSLFDYNALDSETRIVVQQRTSEIKTLMRRTAQDIIDIGGKFAEIRDLLRHNKSGGFEAWCESEGFTSRTARNCIYVHECFGNMETVSMLNFAPKVLYLLASPSTPDEARTEALERAAAGENINPITTQQIITAHKAPITRATLPDDYADDVPAVDYDDVDEDDSEDDEPYPAHQIVWERPALVTTAPQIIPVRSQALEAMHSSESNEWYTPAQYIEAARQAMGSITLDPASNLIANKTVKAESIFTIDDNGLKQSWYGNVWLNPPYGREDNGESNQAIWSARLIEEYQAGRVNEAILLVNAATDRKWFAPLWERHICFTNHRIRFYRITGEADSPTHGNAFIYFGNNPARFIEAFRPFGVIVTATVR